MTRWQWLAVVAVLGVGIVLQIPRHQHSGTAHEHAPIDDPLTVEPGASTVLLAVTGMT
ncbi:MAG: hypothetical protein L0271_01115 [Gemmatimonadetes bacterium]|nr:hypothetical protein [Gemmatimonadota bacterium]